MITVNSKSQEIFIPKVDRPKNDPCGLYFLILHNNYTKENWLFKVADDYYFMVVPRFKFCLEIPSCFEEGEYTYYLVSYDNFELSDINSDFPAKSLKIAKKEAIAFDGMYIVAGETMLVTNKFKAKVYYNDKYLIDNNEVIFDFESDDRSYKGDLIKELSIISTGLFKYQIAEPMCNDSFEEYENSKNEYIQYKG